MIHTKNFFLKIQIHDLMIFKFPKLIKKIDFLKMLKTITKY